MSNTLILVVASILLLLLLFPLFFFVRRRVELSLEGDELILDYPFTSKRIDLEKELESWRVQQAYYLRWGLFYSIDMQLKNGKHIAVSSMLNQANYDLLHKHLRNRYSDRRKPDKLQAGP